jgi:Ca-activated chloride channel homolog
MDRQAAQSLPVGGASAQLDVSNQSALDLQVLTSHERLPVLVEEQAFYALLSLVLRRNVPLEPLPLNLCLVIDRSTSMQGARLHAVQEATRHIIDRLRSDDSLALVVFNDRADVLLPAQRNVDRAMVKAALSVVQPAGGTELLQGLGAGMREVVRGRTRTSLNHVVLLTDGRTYGDAQGCLDLARWAGEHQIGISPMGIGEDWNEDLLDEVAQLSGGRSDYIDTPRRVLEILDDAISHLTRVLARQVTLHIAPGAGVVVHEAFQVVPDIRRLSTPATPVAPGASVGVEPPHVLGSLGAGQRRVVLVEFRIQDARPGRQPVAGIRVEADIPGRSGDQASAMADLAVEMVPHSGTAGAFRISSSDIPNAIPNALAKVALLKMQERVSSDLAAGQLDDATQRLEALAVRLGAFGEMDLARSAVLEAGQLARTGVLSPEGRKKIRYGTRGLSLIPQGEDHD